MSNELWAAIVGAVVGAAIAGLVGFLLQRQSLKAADSQREKDALERKQSLARSFIVHLTILHSHLAQMDRHMQATFEQIAQHPEPKPEPWQVVRPVIPLPALMQIPTDELTLLLALKQDELFNDVVMIDETHNTVISIFEQYGRAKSDLAASMTPDGVTGEVAHMWITSDQLRQLRPKMMECNQLAVAMRERSEDATKKCWPLLSRAAVALNEKLQLKLEVSQVLEQLGEEG